MSPLILKDRIPRYLALFVVTRRIVLWTLGAGKHPDKAATVHEEKTIEVQDNSLNEYRAHLVSAKQKAQEDYDKTVLTLSGGALGVSFAFVKDIVGPGPITLPGYLFSAWFCWGLSVTFVLFSLFTSQSSLRRAIMQVDSGTIYKQRPGGSLSLITSILNAFSGLLFVVGVVFMILFVWFNLGKVDIQPNEKKPAPSTANSAILFVSTRSLTGGKHHV